MTNQNSFDFQSGFLLRAPTKSDQSNTIVGFLRFFTLTNIIICCGGFVASGPRFSVASNCARASSNAWTNSRHAQSTYRTIRSGTAARRCGCADGVSNRICHRRHGHRIGTRTAVRRYACVRAASDSPWTGRICRKTDTQTGCYRPPAI